MIPVSLTLSGFLSYKDPVTLDFTTFDLACIAGPNGAGKSSLLDALTYALFGKARRADEAVINLASDSAFVELVFEYEGNRYRVQRTNPRGKSTVLEFQIGTPGENGAGSNGWKPLTQRTVRDTQRSIEETLRLDYETFINASFFLQGQADQFTQQNASQRKAILGSILGLETWEHYRIRAAEQRRNVEGEVKGVDGRLAEIHAELSEAGERTARLELLHAELDRLAEARLTQEGVLETIRRIQAGIEEQGRFVASLEKHVDAARKRASQVEVRLEGRRKERDETAAIREREADIRAAFAELELATATLAEWDAAHREHEAARREPQVEIEKARARLETELGVLAAAESEADRAAGERAVAAAKIDVLRAEHEKVLAQLQDRDRLADELTMAKERLSEAKAENPRLKREMEELKERIENLKNTPEEDAPCPVCGQPLTAEHRAELIDMLTAAGKEKGDQYRSNSELMKTADERVRELEKRLAALRKVEPDERRLARELDLAEAKESDLAAVGAAWEADGRKRLAAVRKELKEERFAPEARKKLAKIDAALKETGYDAAEADRLRALVRTGDAIREDVRKLDLAGAALEPLDRELGELERELEAASAELAEQETAWKTAEAALAEAKAGAPDFKKAQRDLLDMQEQENQLRMRVGSAQQKVDVLDSLRERKAGLDEEKAGCLAQIANLRQLERAFGKDGVPALLIEQAIPQIESKANELLERLSGGEMSVRFETQRELKTRDSLRETLDITISDAAGVRDYEMYSGGEAFRVNFAVRLALSEVLARRAGARLQTLVIDEGFGSQDEAGRQRLIEAINMVRGDFAKVLVITHIEALKDAFPTRIEVEKGSGGSRVSVIAG